MERFLEEIADMLGPELEKVTEALERVAEAAAGVRATLERVTEAATGVRATIDRPSGDA